MQVELPPQQDNAPPDGSAQGTDIVRAVEELVGEAGETVRQTTQQALPDTPQVVPGLDLGSLVVAAGVLTLTVLLRWLFDLLADKVRLAPESGRRSVIELSLRIVSYAVLLGGLFFTLSLLNLPTEPFNWDLLASRIYLTLLIVFGAISLHRVVSIAVHIGMKRASSYGVIDLQVEALVRDLVRLLTIAVSVILIVQAWGYNATALVAGLGLGGLALAFAAQNTIGNLFGSIVIYAERPYGVGDWVTVGDAEGIVEHIGMRSTHIRRWDKTLAIVPNRIVAEQMVVNNSALTHRRIRFHLALKYEVDAAQMRKVLEALTELVSEHPGITDHWLHVRLERFTPISQDILIQAYCGTTDYGEFLVIQESLLLKVRELVDAMGAGIAVPTGTVVSSGG